MRKKERKLFFYTRKLCERVAREVKEKEHRARATSYLTVNLFSIEICKNSRTNLKGIFSCLREGLVPYRSSLPKWRSLAKQVGETPLTISRFRSTVTNSLTSVFRRNAVWIRPFGILRRRRSFEKNTHWYDWRIAFSRSRQRWQTCTRLSNPLSTDALIESLLEFPKKENFY